MFKRARAFQQLGYRTAVLHDSDKIPTPDIKATFEASGGPTFAWRANRSIEEELFLSLSDGAALAMLEHAVLRRGEKPIDDQIRSVSEAKHTLASCRAKLTPEARAALGQASKAKQTSWYKSIPDMEAVARDIVGPDFEHSAASFMRTIAGLSRRRGDGSTRAQENLANGFSMPAKSSSPVTRLICGAHPIPSSGSNSMAQMAIA